MTILYFLDIPFEMATTVFSQLPQIFKIVPVHSFTDPHVMISWHIDHTTLIIAERECQIEINPPVKLPCTRGQLTLITNILNKGQSHIDNKVSYSILALNKSQGCYHVLTTKNHYPAKFLQQTDDNSLLMSPQLDVSD
jgi:hypothetical protein